MLALAMQPSDVRRAPTLSSVHADLRTVLDELKLEPSTKAYVCCPRCFSCYPFTPGDTTYPTHCTKQDTPSSPVCSRLLRKTITVKGVHRSMPSRQFLHHDMKQWLARLYSRPGMEAHLDRDIFTENGQDARTHRDVWDAPALRTFLGPDGHSPFMRRPGNEGRLIFSLCMDGFNPYRVKEAGKKVTACAIYMVCLNLPPEIRYDMENMYLVGIVPGPNEPSLHQINHILSLIVDDLLELWHHGVFLDRTPLHPRGRCVRCALGPLVCDLPAARQMSGMASHSSRHFCSRCLLKLDDIENLNCQEWPSRSWEQHLNIAAKWRDAQSEQERDDIFEENGLRWTELLRLPYWDPTCFILVDSMHGLLLGLFKRHVRDIWGMDVTFDDGDGKSFDKAKNAPSEQVMQEAHKTLRAGSRTALGKLKAPVLRQLCRDTQSMRFVYKRKRLLASLLEYVSYVVCLPGAYMLIFSCTRELNGDGSPVMEGLLFRLPVSPHQIQEPDPHPHSQKMQMMSISITPQLSLRPPAAKDRFGHFGRQHSWRFAASNCSMRVITITIRILSRHFFRNLQPGYVYDW